MTGPDSGLEAAASAWREADPDPETRAELDRLLGTVGTVGTVGMAAIRGAAGTGGAVPAGPAAAATELAGRFEGSLAFGTAGIRAAMGAGPMRMNRLVAGRVAAGLARYIAVRDPAAAAAGSMAEI